MTIRLTINDQPVLAEEGVSILVAARQNGITIPTLCYHKDLSPVGSCRLCLVEVDGARGQVAACVYGAENGMVVRTETPATVKSRRAVLEMLLMNYVDAGYASEDGQLSEFMHWVNHYGARLPENFQPKPRFQVDSDPNPFVRVDFNKCIL